MAPRKPKVDDDSASVTSTDAVLKPNTTNAKVSKPKADKPKATPKPKTAKVKAVAADGEEDPDTPEKKKPVKKVLKKVVAGGAGAEDGGKGDGKPEKVKAVTGDEAVKMMLDYLKVQNRPYSATDVSANLHNKVTKTNADKLLKEMEQNGQIMGKATKKDGGGQWVFWAIQDPSDSASPTELAAMDTQIATLRGNNPILKSTLKTLTAKLTNIKSAPTTSELSSTIESLQASIQEKRAKLEGFKNGSVKTVTKEELHATEKEWKYWNSKRMLRKKAFAEMEGTVLDGMETSKEDLWDKAGLEEDVL